MAERSSFSTDAKIFRNALLAIALIVLIGYGAVTLVGADQIEMPPGAETSPTFPVYQPEDEDAGDETEPQTEQTPDDAAAEAGGDRVAAVDAMESPPPSDDQSSEAIPPSREARLTAVAQGTPLAEGGFASGQGDGMGRLDADARQTAVAQGTPMPEGMRPIDGRQPDGAASASVDAEPTAVTQDAMALESESAEGELPQSAGSLSISPLQLTAIAQGTFIFGEDASSLPDAQATPDALAPSTQQSLAPVGAATLAPGSALFAVTSTGDAKLYDRPAGDVIKELGAGASLDALARTDDGLWTLVQNDNTAGWIPVEQLVVYGIETLPVLSELEASSEPTRLPEPSPQPIGQPVAQQPAPQPDLQATATAPSTETAPTTQPSASTDYIEPVIATVASRDNRLNVRSGPATDYDIVARLNPGEEYIALARTAAGDWVQLALPDADEGSGWASAAFLDLGDAVESLPVSDEFKSDASVILLPTPTASPTPTPLVQLPPSSAATAVPSSADTQPSEVRDGSLTLRTGPGLEFDVLKEVSAGLDFIELERSDDGLWTRIAILESPGGVGWASVESIDLVPSTASESPSTDVDDEAAEPTATRPSINLVPSPTPQPVPTVESTPEASDDADSALDAGMDADVADSVTEPPAPTVIVADQPVTATVISDNAYLNVRSGPGVDYEITAQVEPGVALSIVSRTNEGEWTQIRLDADTTGWVASDFIEVSEPSAVDDLSGEEDAVGTDTVDSNTVVSATADASPANALGPPKYLPVVGTDALATSENAAASLGGTLVFEASNGGPIYGYDLDTAQLWPITTGFDPAISPDGGTVAFTRDGGAHGLYLIDIDGGNERRIFSGDQRLASPKWSPDGAQLIFSHGLDAYECIQLGPGGCTPISEWGDRPLPDGVTPITWIDYHLAVVDINGDSHHEVATLNSARAPDWTESGIVYQSDAGLQRTTDEPGAASQEIISNYLKPYFHDPAWQPGGDTIVYMGKEGSHWEIFSVNADGSGQIALTKPKTALVDEIPSNVSPAWSPDGTSIVFLSNRTDSGEAGDWRLWIMDADGGNQRPLPIDVPMVYSFGIEQMVSWGR